jgi:xanthine dehydrogenase accessory factor
MDIIQELAHRKAAGEPFVLATIVRVSGSSPRQPGARMLVFPNGTISGTIGGGYFEKLVIEDCLGLLAEDTSHLLKTYRFEKEGPEATGMNCGGRAEVFLERFAQREQLIIFGAGHIGRDLARLAAPMNLAITIVDDRREMLEQFTPPAKTILTDAQFTRDFPAIGRDSYIVIVTHGHVADLAVLRQVVTRECVYIGMIGSKAKIAAVYSALEQEGVERASLARVHAPIGLDIGGEGPYEIALSIIAEIIAVRKKKYIPHS